MSQPESAVLTVILAAKDPPPAQFDACIASIAALRNAPLIDLLVVSGGEAPVICERFAARLHSARMIQQEPRGVYAAYNRGLDEAHTPYVMVMGCDDLLLPGFDNVLSTIPVERRPDMIAAQTLMQDRGISRPSRRRWGLIFRNWCQQGILYNASVFASRRFDCKYRMQADHQLNMELVSNPASVIEYRDDVVCHFSSSGISQTVNDWKFREDAPRLIRTYYGPVWGGIALAKRWMADVVKQRPRQRQRELSAMRDAGTAKLSDSRSLQ